MHRSRLALAVAMALTLATAAPAFAGPAQIIIVNVNAPGAGFNDPTPAVPVGGNTGTTLGQQRLIAFQHAANIWGARLDSAVPIRIQSSFESLPAGVLGSAGPIVIFGNFANAPLPNTWYHGALANALAGVDLAPDSDDIRARFSTNFNFYLGLDNQAPAGRPDLVAVLLHEFAHGLGFSQFANITTGALFAGFADVYNSRLFDQAANKYWPQMTNAERAASATRWSQVVLDAPSVTAAVPTVLALGSPEVSVSLPAPLAGQYQFGTAAFGPAIGSPSVAGSIVAAADVAEPGGTTTDGCTAPLTNAAALAGNIALVERGGCGFAVKARNASAAGAVGVIIYNQLANAAAAPPGMSGDGVNDAFVTAPTVSVRRADALAFLAQPAGSVQASIGVNLAVRAGADAVNRARVFAPNPTVSGSSISHYDSVARRNLLMEPAISVDLTHRVKAPDDLTFELFTDLGWRFPDADGDGFADDEDCNANSIVTPTIVLGGIDTGVANVVFPGGCTSADQIAAIKAGAGTHGAYVSGVAALTNTWKDASLITGREKGAVQSAAARDH